jgi:GAF domain-containing protein
LGHEEALAVSTTLERPAGHHDVDDRVPAAAGGGTDGDVMRRAFAAFSRVLAVEDGGPDMDDLLHVVAKEMSALVGVGRCSIHLRDEPAGIYRGRVGHSGRACLDQAIKRSLAGVPADGMTRELLETGRPVIVDNARSDPRMVKSTVRFWKIRSIMAVPMIHGDDIVGVIFLDDVDQSHAFSAADADIATVFGKLCAVAVAQSLAQFELRSQVDAAQRQLKSLRRAAAVDERLADLVLEGRSLRDLLQALAELLGKPCAVVDVAGQRLATGLPAGAADGIVPRLLESELASRPEVRDALAAHDGSRAFVVGPLPAAGVLHRHVVAPVVLGTEIWGHLVVMEHKCRFTGGDMVTLRRAATLVALHVTTERRALEADLDAASSLASELLSGSGDDAVVQQRADRIGVRLDVPRVVVLVASRGGAEDRLPDFRTVAGAFRDLAPELALQVTAAADGVAALVEVPGSGDEDAFVEGCRAVAGEVLGQLSQRDDLVAGISAVHRDRAGYRGAYCEARQVVDCIRHYSPAGGPAIFTADELGAGRMFLSTSDGHLVTSFAEETFGVLVNDASKSDLLVTLCSFFENMASIRRSAACLNLHENTIRYRLSRIEELTGLAVTHDPDAQLRARLLLLVLLLQGRLPARADGGERAERPMLEVVR